MRIRADREKPVKLIYERLLGRHVAWGLVAIATLTILLPALIALAEGNLRPNAGLQMSWLQDPVAGPGVGLGIVLVAGYSLLYISTLRRDLLTLLRRRTIGAPVADQRKLISAFAESLESRRGMALLLIPLIGSPIWMGYVAKAGISTWFMPNDGRGYGLNVAGTYYSVISAILFLMYATVVWYAVKVALLFRRLIALGGVRINPLHPDRSGGLAFVGELGVRNAYPIVIGGFHVLLVVYSDLHFLQQPLVSPYHATLFLAYIVSALLVFFMPLAVFHGPMQQMKNAALASLDARAERAYRALMSAEGIEARAALAEVECIKDTYAVTASMPVWPFSFPLVRRFGLAVGSPLLAGLIGNGVNWLFSRIH
jgi:hypothetical protein